MIGPVTKRKHGDVLPAGHHRFATQSAYQPAYHVAKSENRPSHQSDNPPAHHVIATQSDNPPTHHIATQSNCACG
ncbi:hypothetical protein PCANC_26901 [Puccinia coronata f. sp. avenae]|uniref:Uncharacterized protein n=1 Tax=Puccinia coronata f. sp. avenae TaxID=200324 RepID=A0A2N5TNB5_9BASI|nr:hypothetical protein PCANC_26901 [Puccinia coronata f. sp. avenae]